MNIIKKVFTANVNRQSNMELLRIVSMMLVVLLHCNYFSLGIKSFDPQSTTGFTRIFCEQLCIVCVNVFVLISGWFGVRPKVKGLMSLLFQVIFFSLVIIVTSFFAGMELPEDKCWSALELGKCYWFIPSYIILYVLSPILNKYIDGASRKELALTLCVFFSVELLYGWWYSNGNYNNGYSALSFIGLYLLARFCRLYPLKVTSLPWYVDICVYLLFALLSTTVAIVTKHPEKEIVYNSPYVLVSSLYLLLAFTKIKINSRLINWVACSAFGVYLIHQNPLVAPYFQTTMHDLYADNTGAMYIVICLGIAFGLLVVSTIVDKLRMIVWNYCLLGAKWCSERLRPSA